MTKLNIKTLFKEIAMKTTYEVRYLVEDNTLSMKYSSHKKKTDAVKEARFLYRTQNKRFHFVNKITSEVVFKVGKIKGKVTNLKARIKTKQARSQTGNITVTFYRYDPPQRVESIGGKMLTATHGVVHGGAGRGQSGYGLTKEPDYKEICDRAFGGRHYTLTDFED